MKMGQTPQTGPIQAATVGFQSSRTLKLWAMDTKAGSRACRLAMTAYHTLLHHGTHILEASMPKQAEPCMAGISKREVHRSPEQSRVHVQLSMTQEV